MTATKQKSQCQRLLAYLRTHKRGITTMEAFRELGITCVHKRIAELEEIEDESASNRCGMWIPLHKITRQWVNPPCGNRHVRYSLAK